MKPKNISILRRKTVKYDDSLSEKSGEKSGEKSIAKSQKPILEMFDLALDASRVILPTDILWARFFKPGEASLTENELKSRKKFKIQNHRFFLQLNTMCDRIKIIQGELSEDQKIKLKNRRIMLEEQERKAA